MKEIFIKRRKGEIPCEVYQNEPSKRLYVEGHLKGEAEMSVFLGYYNLIVRKDTPEKVDVYYLSYNDGAYTYLRAIDMPIIKGKTREEVLISLLCSLHNNSNYVR